MGYVWAAWVALGRAARSYLIDAVLSFTALPTDAESTLSESTDVESTLAASFCDDPQAVIAIVANRIAIIVIFFILVFVFDYDCV